MEWLNLKDHTENGSSPTLWDRPSIFLNLCFFLAFTNIALLYLYPLAVDRIMENAHHAIGLVMGVFSVATVISRPFMGKVVALKGEYWAISLGMAISFLASLGYTVVTASVPGMLLVRVIHGIGFSAFIAGSFSLLAKSFHPRKRGEAFSLIGVALMAAIALAPPFGEFLIRQWGFHALYMAASASAISAWIAAFIVLKPSPLSRHKDEKTAVKYLPLIKNHSYLFLLCSTLIFAHCQATVTSFLALIASEKGIASGRFFFASYFVSILVLLTMGKLIDRYGKLRLLRSFYPVYSLGILLIPGMITSSLFVFPALLYGIGMGLLFPTHNALAAAHGHKFEKPAIMSLFTATYDTGFITGPIVSGWFAHHTSLDMLFLASGILALFGFFMVQLSPIKEDDKLG
jgi:MFS family permease